MITLQSVCLGLPIPKLKHGFFSNQLVSQSYIGCKCQSFQHKEHFRPARLSLKGGFLVQASAAGSDVYLNSEGSVDRNSGVAVSTYNGVDPFRGKAGLITFSGLTYEKVEEAKLESAPFEVDRGSFLWPLAPVALLASLIIPQLFLGNAFTGFFGGRGILLELLVTISYDVVFYIGLAIFLSITNQVQKPYLEYSSKRWGLITGLRGYLTSAFFTMGIKVIMPLFAIYVAWPMLGLQSLVALFPFLAGCAAQFAFESFLDKNGSSCWPIVPIIFEVYRLYQLTKAAQYVEKLMYMMGDLPQSQQLIEKSNAMFGMVVTIEVVGLACLWSLITFLMRLFPSRPVSENY